MSEHKSSDIGHLWLLAGFGMAAVGAKLMWDNFARLHRAGEPARLLVAPQEMDGVGDRRCEVQRERQEVHGDVPLGA